MDYVIEDNHWQSVRHASTKTHATIMTILARVQCEQTEPAVHVGNKRPDRGHEVHHHE